MSRSLSTEEKVWITIIPQRSTAYNPKIQRARDRSENQGYTGRPRTVCTELNMDIVFETGSHQVPKKSRARAAAELKISQNRLSIVCRRNYIRYISKAYKAYGLNIRYFSNQSIPCVSSKLYFFYVCMIHL
jgi:ribosomal protein L16/L10AE